MTDNDEELFQFYVKKLIDKGTPYGEGTGFVFFGNGERCWIRVKSEGMKAMWGQRSVLGYTKHDPMVRAMRLVAELHGFIVEE